MNRKMLAVSGALILGCTVLTACSPSDKQKAEWAEKTRVDCLDKFCEGDVAPTKFDPTKETSIKLNGQWYFLPKQYAVSQGLAFYWPSKTPVTGRADRQDYPERGKDFYDVAIEIFLQHHDGVTYGPNRYDHLRKAETEGRVISKELRRPGLEVWRTRETDGLGPGLWYVATQYTTTDPNGSVLSCRSSNPKFDRCVTAFQWQPGIGADMRFRAKHADDWSEIYQEMTRVL